MNKPLTNQDFTRENFKKMTDFFASQEYVNWVINYPRYWLISPYSEYFCPDRFGYEKENKNA